ncbi:hypothetical protein BT69DRAFT_280607 [Atractiella rhizophila]|nr:hypothetical protein BT69DRAFT_280607 [Atractiella rhizophila]
MATAFWQLPSAGDTFQRLYQAFVLLDSFRAKACEGNSELTTSKEHRENINGALRLLKTWGQGVQSGSSPRAGINTRTKSKCVPENSLANLSAINPHDPSVSPPPIEPPAQPLPQHLEHLPAPTASDTAVKHLRVDGLRHAREYTVAVRHYETRGKVVSESLCYQLHILVEHDADLIGEDDTEQSTDSSDHANDPVIVATEDHTSDCEDPSFVSDAGETPLLKDQAIQLKQKNKKYRKAVAGGKIINGAKEKKKQEEAAGQKMK